MKSTIKKAEEYKAGFKLGLILAGFNKLGELIWKQYEGDKEEIVLERCARCNKYDYDLTGGLCETCFND